jgi:kynurenine formamidase
MRGTTFLEIIENVDQISRREFFVMALPFLVKGIDSGWCRAIVIEDK